MPDNASVTLDELLEGVEHTAPSVTKYRRLEARLADVTGLPAGRIYAGYVSKPGNLSVRMTQSPRAKEASLLVALAARGFDPPAMEIPAVKLASTTGQPLLILQEQDDESWRPAVLIIPDTGEHIRELADRLRDALQEPVRLHPVPTIAPSSPRPSASQLSLLEAEGDSAPVRTPVVLPALRVDPRTRRMLRNAIAAHKAIMLVGPPGTGKTSLVLEAMQQQRADPASFGMTISHEVMVVTADESWTTRELVGGQSVDDSGRLRFVPGFVLQAIQEDKWLLLDEANRADMDKIFGGLLTWLTGEQGEPVTIGRASPEDPRDILLGWSDTPDSRLEEEEADGDDEEDSKRTTRYEAGREWRLIGTYNSVDAQRVFRFGLALGRRFAQVPVPPPPPELFKEIINERARSFELPHEYVQQILERIVCIYRIHHRQEGTALGPALFLTLPGSISAGLREPDADHSDILGLVAEAYLLCFGPWLARLSDDAKDSLEQGMSEPDALGVEWAWVREQLGHLG